MRPLFLNMLPVLLLLGAAQGAFLALVLARLRKGNGTANRILAGILVLFSIGLVEGFLSVTYAFTRVPCLIGVNWPLSWLYGPLVYFYVKALTGPMQHPPRWKLFLHAIPAALLYLYALPFYLADPASKARVWLVENGGLRNYTSLIDPILYVLILQIAGYLVLSLRLLAFHARAVQQNFSSIETINLVWLRNLIFVFFGLLCIYTFYAVSSQFLGIYKETEYVFHLITAALIYVLGYRGIQQPEIFFAQEHVPAPERIAQKDGPAQEPGPSTEAADRTDKYRKSALNGEQAEKILSRLGQVMDEERPYREMGLTLPTLAHMLDVSQHHLSQVINEKLNKSFFDFVNEYRVRETKKALASSDSGRFSILGIAMDAGFNSKSAFYTAFKKHTGMTPSQFKEQAKLAEPVSLQKRQ